MYAIPTLAPSLPGTLPVPESRHGNHHVWFCKFHLFNGPNVVSFYNILYRYRYMFLWGYLGSIPNLGLNFLLISWPLWMRPLAFPTLFKLRWRLLPCPSWLSPLHRMKQRMTASTRRDKGQGKFHGHRSLPSSSKRKLPRRTQTMQKMMTACCTKIFQPKRMLVMPSVWAEKTTKAGCVFVRSHTHTTEERRSPRPQCTNINSWVKPRLLESVFLFSHTLHQLSLHCISLNSCLLDYYTSAPACSHWVLTGWCVHDLKLSLLALLFETWFSLVNVWLGQTFDTHSPLFKDTPSLRTC